MGSITKATQDFLKEMGIDVGISDGIYGKKTARGIQALISVMKSELKDIKTLTGTEQKAMIIDQAQKMRCSKEQIAYILATVKHETNGTFKPVREAYWLTEKKRKKLLKRYYPYYGRGHVQLTWRENYKKFTRILRKHFDDDTIDLVIYPDLLLDPSYSIFVLCYGMKHGSYTGKKLSDYINRQGKCDYVNARRIVNALDKAQLIAGYAQDYLEELQDAKEVRKLRKGGRQDKDCFS